MRSTLCAIIFALFASLACAADSGIIAGKITNPKKCQGVQALLRAGEGVKYPSAPKVFQGAYDQKTGVFCITNLPEGRYDLRVFIKDGLFEGVDMLPCEIEEIEKDGKNEKDEKGHPDAKPVKDEKAKEPFPVEHKKAISEVIANLPDTFSDIKRPLIFTGSDKEAQVLVEKVRCRSFHSGKQGEIIWRIEVWTFENRTGAWVKTLNRPVICRLRIPKDMPLDKFKKLTWIFSPDIGGIEVSADTPIEGLKLTVPKPDMSQGKVNGSVSKQIEKYQKQNASSE